MNNKKWTDDDLKNAYENKHFSNYVDLKKYLDSHEVISNIADNHVESDVSLLAEKYNKWSKYEQHYTNKEVFTEIIADLTWLNKSL